ncbi:MAG: hypothetical protein ACYS30_21130 [Planctomycetota bacterium]
MKAKKWWIVAAVLAVYATMLVSSSLWAVNDKELEKLLQHARRLPLEGLEGVMVSIDVDPQQELRQIIEEKHGLTEEGLKTFTELQLRRNGIKVLSTEDWFETVGRPRLIVQAWVALFMAAGKDKLTAAIYISIELIENAILKRNPNMEIDGVTWQEVKRGFVGTDELKNEIEDAIEDILHKFCNDYLAANPKEPAKEKAPTLDELLEQAAKEKDE